MEIVAIWSHAIVLLVAVLLTSGCWLTAYFAGVKPATDRTLDQCNKPPNTCDAVPPTNDCTNSCEFVICESIPAGLKFDPQYPVFNSTTSCWQRLMSEAQDEVLIGSYYWSLLVEDTGNNYTTDTTGTAGDGKAIYNGIQDTAKRGVKFRITQSYDADGIPETENLAKNSNGNIAVRSLDFTQWYPGGILHTKSWAVDRKHFYVGSTNFDWRSFTQVKELGLAAFNCPCLAEDVSRILEVYWQQGAPAAKIPDRYPDSMTATTNAAQPKSVPQKSDVTQDVYFSVSPPGFKSCGREDDLDAMIRHIDDAQDYLNMAVMDYAPSTLYIKPLNSYFSRLDDAIRRAAFDRQVHVRFLHSKWSHTYHEMYAYLHSLNDLSDELPCAKNSTGACVKKGAIEVRMIEVPAMSYGDIPYARVYHNKYFVTEKTAYIGTSNWSADYWLYTAGIGVVVQSEDSNKKSQLVDNFNQIFMRDWNSDMTTPISMYNNSGYIVPK